MRDETGHDAVAVGELGQIGTTVDLTSDTGWIQSVRSELERRGIRLEVKQLQGLAELPVYMASLDDTRSRDPMFLVTGHAAHPDGQVALQGAILEALQARASVTAGAREDLDFFQPLAAMGYDAARRQLAWWHDATPDSCPAPVSAPLPEDLARTLVAMDEGLVRAGFGPVAVVDLTPPDLALPVVRVVVPGCSDVTKFVPSLAAATPWIAARSGAEIALRLIQAREEPGLASLPAGRSKP